MNRIEELAHSLKGKTAAASRETLMQDVDRLRGGSMPASLDKYIPLIYETPASLFDYARGALLFVSEWTKARERARTANWSK